MFENTRKFQNMQENVRKCQEMQENFGKMSENAEKGEKILGNIRKCKKLLKNVSKNDVLKSKEMQDENKTHFVNQHSQSVHELFEFHGFGQNNYEECSLFCVLYLGRKKKKWKLAEFIQIALLICVYKCGENYS